VTVRVGAPPTTVRVNVWEAVTPSPVAVTVTMAAPTVAVDEAVRVRVDERASETSVTGLTLHAAVTPVGNPLTVSVAAPVKVELPARPTTSVTDAPCAAESVVEAGVTVSVAGERVTVMGTARVIG